MKDSCFINYLEKVLINLENKNERLILLTLAALQFTNIVDFMIIMPLGDSLMKLFKIAPHQFSIIVSAYAVSAAVFSFIAASIIDRFDRKKSLMTVYIGFTIGTFLCAFAPNYEMLIAARAFTGAFGGSMGALIFSIIADLIPVERRSSALGVVMASFSLASIAGVPLGLIIANKFSWHTPFIFLGITSALLLFAIVKVVPNITSHLSKKLVSPFRGIYNLLKDRNLLLGLIFMLLLILGQFTIIPFIAPYLVRNVGFTPDQVPLMYLVGGAVTMISSPLVGKLADKKGRRFVFYIFALFSLIPLFITTNLQITPIYVVLTVTGFFFISITGRMIPASTLITSLVKPENRGSFMSLNSAVQQIGAGLGSWIAGSIVIESISDHKLHNFNYVGYIAMGFTILAIIIASRLKLIEGK